MLSRLRDWLDSYPSPRELLNVGYGCYLVFFSLSALWLHEPHFIEWAILAFVTVLYLFYRKEFKDY